MSYIYSLALVEAYSLAECWDIDASVQSKTAPMRKPSLFRDKTMEASLHFQFGMTSQLLTEPRGEELLTWWREAFPAKTLANLGLKQESRESGQDCGQKWPESFARLIPEWCSWRTSQRCFIEGWELYSVTWPKWGLMRNGECWEQPTWEPITKENGCGFWPTLKASDGNQHSSNLEYFKRREKIAPDLPVMVALKTEPTSSGQYGRLNPDWCEWLMGWPIGYTELKPLETAKFLEWRQQHFPFLAGGSNECQS